MAKGTDHVWAQARTEATSFLQPVFDLAIRRLRLVLCQAHVVFVNLVFFVAPADVLVVYLFEARWPGSRAPRQHPPNGRGWPPWLGALAPSRRPREPQSLDERKVRAGQLSGEVYWRIGLLVEREWISCVDKSTCWIAA